MPIKFSCGKCGSVLRVAERHIGKQAKCPKCSERCVVPGESEPDQPAVAIPAPQAVEPPTDRQPEIGPPSAAAPSIGPPSIGPPNIGLPNVGTSKSKVQVPEAAGGAMDFPSFGESPAAASPAAVAVSGLSNAPSADPSPFAAPMPSSGSDSDSSSTLMHPLYQARGMMNWFGWFLFVIGCIYCVTVVGAIVGWLPLWMGSLVKGASKSIKIGVERGDQNQLRLANQRLATFFKICGVITIIYICILAIALVVALIGIIMGSLNAV